MQATRDFTVKTVQKAADLAMQRGSRLYTDSASSYRALKVGRQPFVRNGPMVFLTNRVGETACQ